MWKVWKVQFASRNIKYCESVFIGEDEAFLFCVDSRLSASSDTISLAVCAMKLSILSLLSLLAVGANAHCEYLYLVIISCGKYADHVVHLVTMQYIWVNGADQGQNVDIRVPPNNNPVTDVTSTDLTCNVNGLSGAGVSTATIPAGATVSFFALLHHFLCSPITSPR